jgi:hypothetical protein
MLESKGANFKEQSSKFRDGIAGGDGIVGFRVESIDNRVEMGW